MTHEEMRAFAAQVRAECDAIRWTLYGLFLLAVVAIATPAYAGTFVHPTEGWSVVYPTGWDTNAADVGTTGSPFRTCSSRCRVQMVPEGQAEIVVRTLPESTDEYAELDKITRDTEIVSGPSPSSARRDYRWGGVFHYAVIAVRKGGQLFLVQLAQQPAPDQTGTEYEGQYQSVLESITVTK